MRWSKLNKQSEALGMYPELNGSKLSETAIRTLRDFIEEHLCTQLTLEDLAALVYLSPFHFARCFKASMGLAPHQYVIARRMELAKRLLLTTRLNVAEIAWSIGYENMSHFRERLEMQALRGILPSLALYERCRRKFSHDLELGDLVSLGAAWLRE